MDQIMLFKFSYRLHNVLLPDSRNLLAVAEVLGVTDQCGPVWKERSIVIADDDYNEMDVGYEDGPPEPEFEDCAIEDVDNNDEVSDALVGEEEEEEIETEQVRRERKYLNTKVHDQV
ncbi:hypothetical protein ZOSMA_92G00120 [Zostera marina]|uniref:Uncharacterized protein n=1 Tax=Zostera marina TaxID=29655 RepID=A0A0K9NL26_ZOSMR|nr:hypothetical protein ZOSMA_92G00120 [Zostera marina]